ncbi:MAG: hypothetical protein M3281_04240 [Chloroflexota bacterium]|nr:hypothetical protein [Chloroflexota bacterium]
MLRLLIAGFLMAHALIHGAIWLPQAFFGAKEWAPGSPFDPGHSWLLSPSVGNAARWPSVLLAVAAAVMYLAAGAGLFAGDEWWRTAAVAASVLSLALFALYFNPWLSLAVVIDVAIIWALVWRGWLSAGIA